MTPPYSHLPIIGHLTNVTRSCQLERCTEASLQVLPGMDQSGTPIAIWTDGEGGK